MNAIGNFFTGCFSDPEEAKFTLCYPLYKIKQGLATLAHFTEGPTSWATLGQTINDFIVPYFIKLAEASEEYRKVSTPLSVAFGIINFGEHVNDANYFINGEAYKDLTHWPITYYWRIPSLAAHIFSVPIRWISTSVFLNAVGLAQTIGEIRVFSWAPQAAATLQRLPWLTSVPKIAEAGQWLSQVQIFKWLPALAAYSAIAEGAMCGINVLLFADGIQRYFQSQQKIEDIEKLYLKRLVSTHQFSEKKIDSLLIEKKVDHIALLSFADLNQIIPNKLAITEENQIPLGRLRVKLLHQHNKQFQAKVDMVSSVAQFALQLAIVLGLVSLGGLCFLAFFALTVGVSHYYKAKLTKPDLDSVLL